MTQFYTYMHCKPDLTPFYVGKGHGRRSHDFVRSRNPHYKNIIAKYGRENIIVLVFNKDSEESALKSEIRLIKMLRNAGFILSNITDGGDGMSNITDEIRKKMSESGKGRKHSPKEVSEIQLVGAKKHLLKH